jgi:hypothetical protein
MATKPLDTEPAWEFQLTNLEMRAKGVEYVLQYLDHNDYDLIRRTSSHWPVLIDLGHNRKNLAILRNTASDQGMKGLYANMALFSLNDDPETRLNSIMQRYGSLREADSMINIFLMYDSDIAKDKSRFVPIIRSWATSTADPDLKKIVFDYKRRGY